MRLKPKYLLNSIADYLLWLEAVMLNLEPKARKIAFCANRKTDAIFTISSIPDSAAKRTFIIVTHRPHCSLLAKRRKEDDEVRNKKRLHLHDPIPSSPHAIPPHMSPPPPHPPPTSLPFSPHHLFQKSGNCSNTHSSKF